MLFEVANMQTAAPLFDGWQETMITSCLQGVMGKVYVTDPAHPKSAKACVGCFTFLAGEPAMELVRDKVPGFAIFVPQNEPWEKLIELCYPRAKKVTRYAIRKDTVFDREKLQKYAANVPKGYVLRPIDGELYDRCFDHPQTRDFVSVFETKERYLQLGRGVVITKNGQIAAGASSYTRYGEGIEIEVDTLPDYRRQHLAQCACAALILRCLDEGLYPGWDAQNKASVALSETLGYVFSHEYTAYEIVSDYFNFRTEVG